MSFEEAFVEMDVRATFLVDTDTGLLVLVAIIDKESLLFSLLDYIAEIYSQFPF